MSGASSATDLEIGRRGDAPKAVSNEQQRMMYCGCGGCCILASLITLIVVLSGFRELGPEEQLLILDAAGHRVQNGPWSGIIVTHHDTEIRAATKLGPLQYAVVKNDLTGHPRHIEGPGLNFLGAYDVLLEVRPKVVLQKDEYIRLVNQETAEERVLSGPQTFVPDPLETTPDGVQKAVFLDVDSAVLVLNRETGKQRLVTGEAAEEGIFIPGAYEKVLEVRELIHVLPHEAVIVRDSHGHLTHHSGTGQTETAFFLPPYSKIEEMRWSSHADPSVAGTPESPKVNVSKIDMRAQKMFFKYEVRTSDNVKLQLEGTIFWQVRDVPMMINATSDPEGDVWHHARSTLIQAVSKATLATFMSGFNAIVDEAFTMQKHETFYTERGVVLQSLEVTRFECVDAKTSEILQEIIQETTNRINRLQAQESENEVAAAKMAAEIMLEKQRTELIESRATNSRLEASTHGESEGVKIEKDASAFIGGLADTLPSIDSRLELYKFHKTLESRNVDTQNLASGSATLFLTPEDMNLKVNMNGKKTPDL